MPPPLNRHAEEGSVVGYTLHVSSSLPGERINLTEKLAESCSTYRNSNTDKQFGQQQLFIDTNRSFGIN
jgi:hypothetical protein